ncbi:class I SAM-dependent methyltransferase [Emticicia sp. SJ17W-69]|uniref:class I SAM-dependent methyltransferase n=1 Tax=Emticicia sp. SJ17W-69 TaxID=3421657 RepID=UPI003EBB780D
MEDLERKQHWEKIYQTKDLQNVSWFQPKPTTSLNFLERFNISKTAKIIDIGGGDSYLVDNLLDLGYQNITVLDISEAALEKAKQRLGKRASSVKWIVADAANFIPTEKYDFWHDRAAFHFLTQDTEINNYIDIIYKSINSSGVLVIGTFSEQGPSKCSGIDVKQYSEVSMSERLKSFFEKIKCLTVDHITPFKTIQNFIFCIFKKIEAAK